MPINTNGDTTPSNTLENVTLFDNETTTSVYISEETRGTETSTSTTISSTEYEQTTSKPGIGDLCIENIDCGPEFSICVNNICDCQTDYYEDIFKCKKKPGIGDLCIENIDCGPEFSICVNNTCDCQTDYYEDIFKCKKKPGIGDLCIENIDCGPEFSICVNNICDCQTDYYKDIFKCKKRKHFGEHCKPEESCFDRKAFCDNKKNVCVCYIHSFLMNNECVKKKNFGEICIPSIDVCNDKHAICSSETKECVCDDDYIKKQDLCKKKPSNYWWFGIIIIILLLIISVFFYLLIRKMNATTGRASFMKLKSFKTPSYKRPYKIKYFAPIESKTFIQDYKTLGKVNPFILSDESDINSNDKFLPCHEAKKPANKKKNRFLNILPFDHSRVKLEVIDDDPFSDYINANYITGYNHEKEYIACQGPLIHTVDDFWRMVWQENISLIVMLTLCEENGKRKCYPYWPKKENLKVISRDLLLETDVVITHDFYIESNILVNMDDETRIVKHLHFQKWPDFTASVEPSVLINFVKIVRSYFSEAPVLIHCSAGVGRTGTMIAVDYMLQYVRDHALDDDIDMFSFVYKMRENRPQMVQNQDQYVLINNCAKKTILEKFNLKVTLQTNTDKDNKKDEIKGNGEEIGAAAAAGKDTDVENDTVTNTDGENDSEKVSEEVAQKITVTVEENTVEKVEEKDVEKVEKKVEEKDVEKVADVNTDEAENTKKDGEENVDEEEDEVSGDTDEDKNAKKDVYIDECEENPDENIDENVPLTQKTSEL